MPSVGNQFTRLYALVFVPWNCVALAVLLSEILCVTYQHANSNGEDTVSSNDTSDDNAHRRETHGKRRRRFSTT